MKHDFAEKYRRPEPEIGPVEKWIWRFSLMMLGAVLWEMLGGFIR